MTFWLVAADASKARFFKGASPRDELEEFESFDNEDARLKPGELNTDGPGRIDDPSGHGNVQGMGKSAVEVGGRKDEIIDSFSRTIAEFLRKARSRGDFTSLSIIAAPKFLGRLRNDLDPATQRVVLEEIGKNVTHQDPADLKAHLNTFN